MRQKQLGGRARKIYKLIFEFANDNNLPWETRSNGHMMFKGPNGKIVVISSSPRSPDNCKRALGQLKNLVK